MSTDTAGHRDGSLPTPDYYRGESGVRYFEWQRGLGEWTGRILAVLFAPHVSPQDDVLDFGCGGGYLLKALHARRKVGLDVNPAALEECHRNGVETVSDLAQVPTGSFDIVISNHALEHTFSPADSLRELRRILRPGGRLAICTPVDDWRVYRSFHPDDVHHHLFTWTPQNMGNLLRECGFQVDQIEIFASGWPPKARTLESIFGLRVFGFLCSFWGQVIRYRQLFAKAHVSHE